MVKLPTLLLGTTLGIAALGLSATASAGVPGRYYGPHFHAGAPYHHSYFGPGYFHPHGPVGPWHPGFAARGGYWRR